MQKTDRTETDQLRRKTRQKEYALGLADLDVPFVYGGVIGRELRHRAEIQPLVDWSRNEEWS